MERPHRPAACLEVPIRMDLKEPKTATFTTVKLWISTFLTTVFCGSQLASSSAVPVVPLDAREDLMARRKH